MGDKAQMADSLQNAMAPSSSNAIANVGIQVRGLGTTSSLRLMGSSFGNFLVLSGI